MGGRAPSQNSFHRGPEGMNSQQQADPRKHSPNMHSQQNQSGSTLQHHPSFIKQASTTGHIPSSQGQRYQQPYGNQIPARTTSLTGGFPGPYGMPPGGQRMPHHPPNYQGPPHGPGYSNGMPSLGVGGPQPSIGAPRGGNHYQNPQNHPPTGQHANGSQYQNPMASPRQGNKTNPNPGNNNSFKNPQDVQAENGKPHTHGLPLNKSPSIAPPSGYNPNMAYGPPGSNRYGGPPQQQHGGHPGYAQPNKGPGGGHYQDHSLHAYPQSSIVKGREMAVQPRNTMRGGQQQHLFQNQSTQPVPPPAATNSKSNKGSSNDVPKYQEPKIQNLVSTANLNQNLDLLKLGNNCRNAQYNPKRFAALILRIKEPRTTALIFKNGKMVITGAKSEMESEQAAKKYTKDIKSVGNPSVKLTEFKIQNMVASCSVNFKIKLEQLYHSNHRRFCDFNPETFPGLIYHLEQPKVCLLIFASGKIVLTGAKTREDIKKAFKDIQPLLKEHIKTDLRIDQVQASKSNASATMSSRRQAH